MNLDLSFGDGGIRNTPLTHAAYCKQVEIVSLLINHPNMTEKLMNKGDKFGLKPLHCASMTKYDSIDDIELQDNALKIAQMLINDTRTKINAVNKEGETALMYAIESCPKIAMILIENQQCNINIQRYDGDTAFHILIFQTAERLDTTNIDIYKELCRKILQRKDLDYNITNRNGETALDVAKNEKLHEIVQLITKMGT